MRPSTIDKADFVKIIQLFPILDVVTESFDNIKDNKYKCIITLDL